MSGTEVLGLAGALVLVIVTGTLGAADVALTHLGRAKALSRKLEESRAARSLIVVMEDPGAALNVVLLLRVTCFVLVASITAVELANRAGPGVVVVGIAAEMVALFVVAEAIPKTFALQHPEGVALRVAPIIRLVVAIAPLRWLARILVSVANLVLPGKGRSTGPVVSEEELLALAGAAVESSAIANEEAALITSVIEFGDTVAREIMVPRPDIVTMQGDMTVAQALDECVSHNYSRVPVVGDRLDDLLGVAYAKDLIRAERQGQGHVAVREVVRPAHFVPETKPVAELMREMQEHKFHLVLLVDEYGGIAGLVTLEDLIEELIGDIADEFDEEPAEVEILPSGELRVSGGLGVGDLNELLGTELPDEDWDSVGGFVFGLLGHVPAVGEAIEHGGYRFAAEAVDGHRISLVRVSPADEGVEPATAGTSA